MKKVTTEYFCDLCGNPVEADEVTHTKFPRRVAVYAKNSSGVKIMKYSYIGMVDTDICNVCKAVVSSFFPEIDKEIDTGYQE